MWCSVTSMSCHLCLGAKIYWSRYCAELALFSQVQPHWFILIAWMMPQWHIILTKNPDAFDTFAFIRTVILVIMNLVYFWFFNSDKEAPCGFKWKLYDVCRVPMITSNFSEHTLSCRQCSCPLSFQMFVHNLPSWEWTDSHCFMILAGLNYIPFSVVCILPSDWTSSWCIIEHRDCELCS